MEKLSSFFSRLALAVAGALALGACNRAEYAMLPKSASYLGTKPAAYAPHSAAPVAAAPAPVAPEAAAAPVAADGVAARPAAAPAAAAVSAGVVAAKPAPVANAVPEANVAVAPVPQPKLNLAQRLALKKISKKLNKLAAQTPRLKQRDAAASTARVSGNLRSAIIFGVVGLLLTLLGGVAGIFYVLGVIFIVIGLIFLLLWVLDEA